MSLIDGPRIQNPLALSRGRIPNVTLVHKYGGIVGVGTTLTPVTNAGTYQMPTSATALEVVSSDNTNDKAGGAGALQVTIEGITDWNSDPVQEVVTLNGTTAVPTVNSYLRVYRARVTSSGSYANGTTASHTSTITVRTASAGATWVTIVPFDAFGLSQTSVGAYSIPAGYRAYIANYNISVSSNKTADVVLMTREDADDTTTPYSAMRGTIKYRSVAGNLSSDDSVGPVGPFLGPCDLVWFAASTSTTSDVALAFELIVEHIDGI